MNPKKPSFSAFSILVIFVFFALLGLIAIPQLSIQYLPNQVGNKLTVITQMEKCSPTIVEHELTAIIESNVSRLKGIETIESISDLGQSKVEVTIDKFTDVDVFRFELASLLKEIYPKFPKTANYPTLLLSGNLDKTNQAVLTYYLYGHHDLNILYNFIDKKIKMATKSIQGISEIDISGKPEAMINVIVDRQKMLNFHIERADLATRLNAAFAGNEIGMVNFNDENHVLVLKKQVSSSDELAKFVVAKKAGRIIHLGEIAKFESNTEKRNSFFRINGYEPIKVSFYAEKGANSVKLANQVKTVIAGLDSEIPKSAKLILQYDSSKYIQGEIDKILIRTGVSVIILMMLTLLLTKNGKSILLIFVTLILNVLCSCVFYYLFKLEIHSYTLAGISVSLGLVIDNVIVIIDDLKLSGKNRIFSAIMASTLTSVGAISVVFFLDRDNAEALRDFSISIIINLIISLPIAYFFIPAAVEKLFGCSDKKELKKSLLKRRRIVTLNSYYEKFIRFIVIKKIFFFCITLVLLGLPIFMLPIKIENPDGFLERSYNITIGGRWFRENARKYVDQFTGGVIYNYISNKSRPISIGGISPVDTRTRIQIEARLNKPIAPEDMNQMMVAFENKTELFGSYVDETTTNVPNGKQGSYTVVFKNECPQEVLISAKNIFEDLANLSGAATYKISGLGRGFDNSVEQNSYDFAVELKGYSYTKLKELAILVKDSIAQSYRVNNPFISPLQEYIQMDRKEQILTIYDRSLALRGLKKKDVGNTFAQMNFAPFNIGSFYDRHGYEKRIVGMFDKGSVLEKWNILQSRISPNSKTEIPVQAVSGLNEINMNEQIVRKNQEYILYINYAFVGSHRLNSALIEKVSNSLAPILPFGYSFKEANYTALSVLDKDYFMFLPCVLFIIFAICAMLLESLLQPLAVLAIIPFSFIGVILCFRCLGIYFDQGGYASLLMVSSLVTNAALYVINDFNYMKKNRVSKGFKPLATNRLFIKSFNLKITPILITTVSAILSLIPFMVNGEETGFWFALSAGTIGGLLFSIVGVFFLLPMCLISNKSGVK